jgi:hypothetical protein
VVYQLGVELSHEVGVYLQVDQILVGQVSVAVYALAAVDLPRVLGAVGGVVQRLALLFIARDNGIVADLAGAAGFVDLAVLDVFFYFLTSSVFVYVVTRVALLAGLVAFDVETVL